MKIGRIRRLGGCAAMLSIMVSLTTCFSVSANDGNHLGSLEKNTQALQVPMTASQILLQTEQKIPIDPSHIATTNGGLIVAGSSGARAWAAKTDINGKVLWTYLTEKPDWYDRYPWPPLLPSFRCTLGMPDGSVWLIGTTIDANVHVGLLVHLDRDGKLLASRHVLPPPGSSDGARTNLLMDCVRSGDGVAIAGTTLVRNPQASLQRPATEQPTPPQAPWKLAYWFLVLDAHGNPAYEGVVSTDQDALYVVLGGLTLLAVGPTLVMSATTNVMTEVLRISPMGRIEARKRYPGGYLGLVRPVVPDGEIQLFGSFIKSKADDQSQVIRSVVLLTLADDLREVGRQDVHTTMASNRTYRLADRSLMLFGAAVHEFGERYTSQAAHLDPGLSRIQTLDVRRDNVSDTGMVYTAAPLDSTGRFVLATVAVIKGYPNHPVHMDASPGFLRGAVLDFVELK